MPRRDRMPPARFELLVLATLVLLGCASAVALPVPLAAPAILLCTLPALWWGMLHGRRGFIPVVTVFGVSAILALIFRTGPGADSLAWVIALAATGAMARHGWQLSRRHGEARAEQRSQQHLLDSLMRSSPSLLHIKDASGRYLLVSDSYAQTLHLTPSQMLGVDAETLFPPADAADIRTNDQRVLHSGVAAEFEESALIGGIRRTYLSTKAPFFSPDGRIAGLVCSSVDITDRKLGELALRETENKFQALANLPLVGIYMLQDGKLVYLNDKLADMVGYRPDELLGQPPDVLIEQADRDRIKAALQSRLEGNLHLGYTSFRVRHRRGHCLDVVTQASAFKHEGQPALIGLLMDVTEKTEAVSQLKLTAKVFENASEGIVIADANEVITAVNEAFTRITGFTEKEALGKRSRMFRAPFGEGGFGEDVLRTLRREGHWQGEMLDRRKDGLAYPAWLSISVVRNDAGQITHYAGVFTDITVRKQTEERLHFLANHDPLTALPNRTMFHDALRHAIAQAKLHGEQLALLFIDLDRFKVINDSLGHDAGDQLLRAVAERLSGALKESDLLARLGGDEFVMLIERTHDVQEIAHFAESILRALGKPFMLEGREFFVSCSIGISLFPHDGEDGQSLLKNADIALYRAKETGKNTYQFFSADMNSKAFEILVMENSLRSALKRNEFRLRFQPQIRLSDGQIAGAECLLRWSHPDLGEVPPLRFIPLAEETGLINPIGEWLLHEACREAKAWEDAGLPPIRLSVNLSPRQFQRATLLPTVASALRDSGLAPERLELEITESVIMRQPEEAVALMEDLTDLGVWLAIDDFGTGYSSLSHLKHFPIQTLKIDRSFIEGVTDHHDDKAIAETIITLGKQLGLTVIAEGVETRAQHSFLTARGCDMGQGYLYGRPMTSTALADLLRRGTIPTGEETVAG